MPEDEKEVGSAITVITRQELEKHESAVVSDVLRAVPGLDVMQYGQPGSLTSLFTRGTNSTQTLVLVDGVRMNSPYFSGYDWSSMTTENIERIEIVRGPFSALYGSDAIGGVVQIFTRPGAEGIVGRATGEAGNQGQGQGSAFVSAGEGPFSATASYRYVAFNGDGPNTDWRERNGSASLSARLGDTGRIGVEWGLNDGEVGNPGAIGASATPRRRAASRTRRASRCRATSRSRTTTTSTSCSPASSPSPPTRTRPAASSRRPTRARCRRASRTRRSSATTS